VGNRRRYKRTWGRWAPLLAIVTAFIIGAEADASEPAGGVAAELGYGQVAGVDFLSLWLKLGYTFEPPKVGCDEEASEDDCTTRLRLAAQAPLRFHASDRAAAGDSRLREQDWDEASDFLRLIRAVEYGRASEALHAKIGQLGPVSLGHATLVNDYYNTITVDHYRLGAAGEFDTVYGGVEMVLGDVVSPSVAGVRAYTRPWAFVNQDSFLSRVAVGASLVADVDAPTRLSMQSDSVIDVDAAHRPVVAESQSTSLWGVDLEVSLLESERLGVVPYADLNGHASLGYGLHAGSFVSVRPADDVEVIGQLEYRRVGANYLPNYVGPLYEIDRNQFSGWGHQVAAPKVRVAASVDAKAAHGFYGALTGHWGKLLSLTAALSDHEGPGNQSVRLQASSQPIETVQLGLFYYKQSVDGLGEALDPDGALVVGESRVGIYGPVFALASFGRMWRLDQGGRYQSVDDWNAGLGVSMGF
jgi:hypothetical protein